MINDDFLVANLCTSYVTGCRNAAFTLYFLSVCTADRTALPNAAPICPEPCSSPLEVTATPVKIREGLEGIRMWWKAGSSHWDGRGHGGRWRDADKYANESPSCPEPLILLLLLDCLWQKIRRGRLQINQAVGCLLADYFCRYVQRPSVASQISDVQLAPLPKQHLESRFAVSTFLFVCLGILLVVFFFLVWFLGFFLFHAPHGVTSFPWECELGAVLPALLPQLETDSTKKQSPSQLSSLQKNPPQTRTSFSVTNFQ